MTKIIKWDEPIDGYFSIANSLPDSTGPLQVGDRVHVALRGLLAMIEVETIEPDHVNGTVDYLDPGLELAGDLVQDEVVSVPFGKISGRTRD